MFIRIILIVCVQVTLKPLVFPTQIEEQVKQLQKGVTHIGVGTPGRISALIDRGAVLMASLLQI